MQGQLGQVLLASERTDDAGAVQGMVTLEVRVVQSSPQRSRNRPHRMALLQPYAAECKAMSHTSGAASGPFWKK